jgi:hypothetical protein
MQDQPTGRPTDDPAGQVERELLAAQEEVRELGNILRAALAEDERLAQQDNRIEQQDNRSAQQESRPAQPASQPEWQGERPARHDYGPTEGDH